MITRIDCAHMSIRICIESNQNMSECVPGQQTATRWKSPFSAPCPGLFPATPCSSVLSFLLQFKPPVSFPQNSQKNPCPPLTMLSSPPSSFFLSSLICISDLPFSRSLLQPSFRPPFSAPFLLQKVPPRVKVLL